MSTNLTNTDLPNNPHWLRPGLDVQDDVLYIAGRNALAIAMSEQLPVFVTDLVWIGEQARKLQSALNDAGLRQRVRLAIKAQREP
jgi:diaminopimelate decarboxylase